jgi:hypothetical protein
MAQVGHSGKIAADLGSRREEVMRVGRAIIIPAILALSVAGSVIVGAETAVAAVHTTTVHTNTIELPGFTSTYYHN